MFKILRYAGRVYTVWVLFIKSLTCFWDLLSKPNLNVCVHFEQDKAYEREFLYEIRSLISSIQYFLILAMIYRGLFLTLIVYDTF